MQRYILLDATGVELWHYSDGKTLTQLMDEGWEAVREIPYGASWMLLLIEKKGSSSAKKTSGRRSNNKEIREPQNVG